MPLRPILRGVLAGPVALVAAVAVMLAMSLWLPKGAAEVDQLAVPIVLFPLIWAALFLYAMLDRSLRRAAAVVTSLLLVNGGLVASSFVHAKPPQRSAAR